MISSLDLICILFIVIILEPSFVVSSDDESKIGILHTGWDVRCKFQPNSYNCFHSSKKTVARFYYDIKMQGCKTFQYGGCSLSYNTFSVLEECSAACEGVGNRNLPNKEMDNLEMDVICRLQPDFGTCFDYQPLFYYDISTRTCKGFSYSGCGGNGNRFFNQYECMDVCESAVQEHSRTTTLAN